MPTDITTAKTETRDDYDVEDFADLTDGFAAATTNRRVGRCVRKAPGPSVDDGPGTTADSTDESPEDLGAALIESIQPTLKTRKGFDDLGQALSDHPTDAFAPEELEKLTRTVKQLDTEGIFDTPVYAIARDQDLCISLPSGKTVSVRLAPSQRAAGFGSGDGRIIIVAADLPPVLQTDAALRIFAEEIEAIAAENGIRTRPGGILNWLRQMIQSD